MCINYNSISSIAAIVTALIAIVALVIESKRSRFQMGVDMLLKFNDKFLSTDMLEVRRRAVKGILEGHNDQADDLLDFFETLGLLVRRKGIEDTFVWHSFFYWIQCYYHLTKDYIALIQKDDPTIWEDFVWLYNRLCKVEKKKLKGCKDTLNISNEDLNEFIDDEINLQTK